MSWHEILCNHREVQLIGTLNGGQSFRWTHNPDADEWIGNFAKTVWKLRQKDDCLQYQVIGSLLNKPIKNKTKKPNNMANVKDNALFMNLLEKYFRLNVDLGSFYKKWAECDNLFKTAEQQFYGIRMLAQEPVENLFSFICSQNNHISRISSMVEKLCSNYGEEICKHEGVTYYAFPEVEKLCEPKVEAELRELGFGYRAKFIQKSAAQIVKWGGESWFQSLQEMKYKDAKQELMKLHGIGPKVADCICLMSLHHLSALPVDTHVYQIAAQHYLPHLRGKKNVTDKMYEEIGDHFRKLYGDMAGWAHTNYAGRLEPINPSELQFNQDLPIDYRVDFPVSSPLPRLTYLIVNNNVLCYGPGDIPQPNVYETTISLRHMLSIRGGRPGITQGFDQGFNQGSSQLKPKPQDSTFNVIGSSPDTQVFTFDVDNDRTGTWNMVPEFEHPQQQPHTQRPPLPPPPPPVEYYPDYTTTTRRPAPPPQRPETNYPSIPSRMPPFSSSDCGVVSGGNERVPLVFHGMSYPRGDWPWLVAIYKRKDGSLTFVCSGTLVSNRHVVSAAHCMQQRNTITSIKDIVVKVGVYNLEDWGDDITVTRTLASATIHESYNSSTYANDLLVVTFERSVEFNTNIRPACLWSGNNDLTRIVGASGVVAGWGSSELGPGSKGEPRMVRIPVVSTAMCRASKPDFHLLTSDTTLCAGDRNGAGPCLGDSGGGLYLLEGGRWRLRGVVSLSLRPENGESSCNLNEYIIFTDTAKFLQWIKNAINN